MRMVLLFGFAVVANLSLAAEESPYSGEELRSIKSLSPQEIEALRSGRGMGFAKLAELNHYPGPKHVLELADELKLTPMQLAQTKEIFSAMQEKAVMFGAQLIEAEMALDGHFVKGTIGPESLEEALLRIGEITGRLRNVHLKAHLEQKLVLSAEQIAQYDEIRGYGRSEHDHTDHHRRHH